VSARARREKRTWRGGEGGRGKGEGGGEGDWEGEERQRRLEGHGLNEVALNEQAGDELILIQIQYSFRLSLPARMYGSS
jgi:hypothetical protein